MESLFFLLIIIMLYIYFGYPFLLQIISVFVQKPIRKNEILPNVSIITAAYNEERTIEKYILNKFNLDYPPEKSEIILVSDGSTDQTDQIIQNYDHERVKYLRNEPRQGKTAALNMAVPTAKGEIIIFADANSMYHQDAVKRIVENFADPQVGYVSGRMVYVNEAGDMLGDGCTRYMRYENNLRNLETMVGSIVGVDGGIDAVRKELYDEMDPEMLPDLFLPLSVIEKGYRVVFEDDAFLYETALDNTGDEFRMRVRVILRAWHALWRKRKILNPFKYGLYSLQLFTHKVIRYMAWLIQLAILVLNILLAYTNIIFTFLLIGQLFFYYLGFWGHYLEKKGKTFFVVSPIYYFNLLNLSAMIAFFKFMVRKKQVIWTPRKG